MDIYFKAPTGEVTKKNFDYAPAMFADFAKGKEIVNGEWVEIETKSGDKKQVFKEVAADEEFVKGVKDHIKHRIAVIKERDLLSKRRATEQLRAALGIDGSITDAPADVALAEKVDGMAEQIKQLLEANATLTAQLKDAQATEPETPTKPETLTKPATPTKPKDNK